MAKILLVEDETDLRTALKAALEAASFEVCEAADGDTAIKVALAEHPDVIVMDINLPKRSGHDAMRKIREDRWGSKVKVLYLTAFSDADNVVSAVAQGSEEYVVKSNVSLEEIVAKVRQVYYS